MPTDARLFACLAGSAIACAIGSALHHPWIGLVAVAAPAVLVGRSAWAAVRPTLTARAMVPEPARPPRRGPPLDLGFLALPLLLVLVPVATPAALRLDLYLLGEIDRARLAQAFEDRAASQEPGVVAADRLARPVGSPDSCILVAGSTYEAIRDSGADDAWRVRVAGVPTASSTLGACPVGATLIP